MHQPIESGRHPFHCGPYNRTLHCSWRELHFPFIWKELLVELRQIGKVRTAGTYQNALNSFERFRGHRGDIPLDEMDSNQMITYESWLKGTGVCPNTSSYYMRNLRAIYNRAVSEGLVVQRNPFKHVYTGIDKRRNGRFPSAWFEEYGIWILIRSLSFCQRHLYVQFYTRGMSFVDMAFLKRKTSRMESWPIGEKNRSAIVYQMGKAHAGTYW